MQAITFPALWLDLRGVRLSAKRYEEILSHIIRTVNEHGNLAEIRSPGRYLLHAVEMHMHHHGDAYYEEGKRVRNATEHVSDVLNGLRAIQGADNTVPALAEAHRVLAAAKPGRKPKCKPAATDLQDDFFAPANHLGDSNKMVARDSVRDRQSSQTVVISGKSPKNFSNRPATIQSVVNN